MTSANTAPRPRDEIDNPSTPGVRMTPELIAVLIVAWIVLAIPLGVIIGRVLKDRDRQVPRDEPRPRADKTYTDPRDRWNG